MSHDGNCFPDNHGELSDHCNEPWLDGSVEPVDDDRRPSS